MPFQRSRPAPARRALAAFAPLVAIAVAHAAGCSDARGVRPSPSTPIPAPAPAPLPSPSPREAADDDAIDEDDLPSRGPLPLPAPDDHAVGSPPAHPRTFDDAKRLLLGIYAAAGPSRMRTLYCDCVYVGHAVDTSSCGYLVQSDPARAARLEWEHVVPASAFGRAFREWREGHASCVKKNRPYRGRKCAHLASPEFARIEGDMHNLFPEDGEINNLRGDRMMAIIPGEARRYGACDIEITSTLFEPRPDIRGEVARAYEYMDEAYPRLGLLPDGYRAQMAEWDADDPPDAWERARNDKIAALQGNRNRFIDRAPPR